MLSATVLLPCLQTLLIPPTLCLQLRARACCPARRCITALKRCCPRTLLAAAAGTYRVLPFSAAEFLIEVPYLAVQSTVYSVIVYWCVLGNWEQSRVAVEVDCP